MKYGRLLPVILIIAVVSTGSILEFAWIASFNQSIAIGSLTPWSATTSYPLPFGGGTCVAYSGYIYCVGGGSSSVYYAKVSSAGIGNWSQTTSYPYVPGFPSCVTYLGYLYCVDGQSVYYATINSTGVGSWTKTESYPSSIYGQTCVAYSGYIYCVGGAKPNNPVNASALDYVYFAPITSSGLGTWNETASYPIAAGLMNCVEDSGYIYCIAGDDLAIEGASPNPQLHSSYSVWVYYAKLGPSGIFKWVTTIPYPLLDVYPACATYSSRIYCVAGLKEPSVSDTPIAYYASTDLSGVANWTSASTYPVSVQAPTCVAYSNYIYCIGGFESSSQRLLNSSYYSEIISPATAAALRSQSKMAYSIIYTYSVASFLLGVALGVLGIFVILRKNQHSRIEKYESGVTSKSVTRMSTYDN